MVRFERFGGVVFRFAKVKFYAVFRERKAAVVERSVPSGNPFRNCVHRIGDAAKQEILS